MTSGWKLGLVLVLGLLLPSCSGPDVPNARYTSGKLPELAETPEKSETVRGENDPPVVTLKVSTELKQRRLRKTEQMPQRPVPVTNLQGVPLGVALEGILQDTDVALSYTDEEVILREVNLLNLSGQLENVVDRVCATARVFCAYRNGNLEIAATETFVIDLPATGGATTESTGNSMADAIAKLAATDVQVDGTAGNIIYTAGYDANEKVVAYMEELRSGRPLVVMQLYIWDVTLDSSNSQGINWTSLSFPELGGHSQMVDFNPITTGVSAVTGGVNIGAVLTGKVEANLISSFLSRQGLVQNVSNPQLTFVSGTSTSFTVGGKRRFVSSIGASTTNSVSGGSSTGTSGSTVNTEELNTGVTLEVSGSYESGVIVANMSLDLTDFLGFDEVPTGIGSSIQQPRTSNRKLETVLRVRPGDNLLLAGITSARDDLGRDRMPLPIGGGIPMRNTNVVNNSELVILIKPSVVLFADDKMLAEAKRLEQKRPLPEAVVVDGTGARPLSFMQEAGVLQGQIDQATSAAQPAPTTATSAAPATAAATTETSAASSLAAPDFPAGLNVPVGDAGQDVSLIDKGMLQRGLSYSFDQLLYPAPPQLVRQP